jgi:hypothetical protein
VVGFVSAVNYIGLFAYPGTQELGDGEDQEVSGIYLTELSSGDATTATGVLVAGTVMGQLKKLWFVSDGGEDWVVGFNFGNSVTFAEQGEYVVLIWDGTNWNVFDKGICDGMPVVV